MTANRSGGMSRGARIAFGVGLVLVGISMRASVAEARTGCSSYTPGNRDCTFTEALGYCLTNAMTSYNQCAAGAGFLGKMGCGTAYEFDWYGCYVAVPIGKFFR